MSAQVQIHVFPPPPTINALHPKQRSRLQRSARKLEALLGETPILALDSSSTSSPNHDSHHPLLVLRPNARDDNSLSPISSTFNHDPSPSHLSDKDKRRKMAKLARTLGENVPPELVFHNTTISLSSSSPGVVRTNSFSNTFSAATAVLPVAETPTPSTPSFEPPSNPRPDAKRKRRPRPRSLTLGTMSTFASPALVAATSRLGTKKEVGKAKKEPSNGMIYAQHTRGTASLDSPRVVEVTEQVLAHPKMREDQPFAFVSKVVSVDADRFSEEREEEEERAEEEKAKKKNKALLDVEWDGYRKEREWSGEWNVKDMERVTRALRGLKGR